MIYHAVVNLTFFGGNQSVCHQLFRTTKEAAKRIEKIFQENYSISGVYSNQPQTQVKGYVDWEIYPYQPGIITMSPELVKIICGG